MKVLDGGGNGIFRCDLHQQRELGSVLPAECQYVRQRWLASRLTEPVLAHPGVVVQLAQIAPTGVWQQDDHHVIWPQAARVLQPRRERRATRPAAEDAFLA